MVEKRSVSSLSEVISNLCGNSRKLSVTIIGAFGARNVGDLAIMKTIVNDLGAANGEISYSFASRDEILKNTYRVQTMNPFSISGLKKLLQDDVIVIGGGGLYGHETHRYLVWMLPFLYILKNIFGKKVIFYNVGIYRAEDRKVLKMLWPILARADRVILRDDSDLEILPTNIAARADVEPDITFLLQPEIPKDLEVINLLKTPDYVVGLSLRYTNLKDPGNASDSKISESVKQVIVKEYLEKGTKVVFIPFQPEDLQYINAYFGDVRIKYPEKFTVINTNEMKVEEIKWMVSRLSVAIGMRLHFQIFANDLDIPLIGISYAPKCTNFLKKAKCAFIDAYKIDPDRLGHAIKEATTSLDPAKHGAEIRRESSR